VTIAVDRQEFLMLSPLLPPLFAGLWVTLKIAAGAACLGAASAFVFGLARLSRNAIVRGVAATYVEVFRGTSALVQLFWVYFVLPRFGISIDAAPAAIIVLGLNAGAYGAEVVRGTVKSIARGQIEAAVALNFNPRQRMWRIILPQALPVMLPPFGNLLIELLKNTSLASLITLADLTFRGRLLWEATLDTVPVFGLILIFYFAAAQLIHLLIHLAERRLAISGVPAGGRA
jgi:polar amino acid transport system permease protein